MPQSPPLPSDATELSKAIAAYRQWWRLAGVEWSFADEPTPWITTAEADDSPSKAEPAAKPPPPAKPRFRVGGPQSTWPQTLADWEPWWLSEPDLDPYGGGMKRVAPAGPAGAKLMVIVEQPEADDGPALLGGAQGRLLDAILASIGLTRAEVRLASALPRVTPAPDWRGLAADGLGDVLAHHINLAAPERVLIFGRDLALALASNRSSPDSSANGGIPALVGSKPILIMPDLSAVLARPRTKAMIWQGLLGWDLSGG